VLTIAHLAQASTTNLFRRITCIRSRGHPACWTAVAECIHCGALLRVSMANIWGNAGSYEVAETRDTAWNPHSSVWPAAREWKGPLSDMNVDKVRQHQLIWVKLTSTAVAAGGARKYTFTTERQYNDYTVWTYAHCRSETVLIIRPVQPCPEVHVVMKPWPIELASDTGEVVSLQRSKITAFTVEDESTIHEEIITQDVRASEFKLRVKDRLVVLNKCTRMTSLLIYFHNVPMNSNTMLHSDLRRVRARPAPVAERVIVARDIVRDGPRDVVPFRRSRGVLDLERALAAIDRADAAAPPPALAPVRRSRGWPWVQVIDDASWGGGVRSDAAPPSRDAPIGYLICHARRSCRHRGSASTRLDPPCHCATCLMGGWML